MYLTGMRFGEATGLQFKNIHDQYADITGTMWANGIKSDSPKTLASFRSVFLPKQAIEIVEWFKQHDRNAEPDDFIFINQLKHVPFKMNTVALYLKNKSKEAGIDRKITTHFFRHTHISKLAEQGVPLHVIQKRVGHIKAETTREIYLHVTKKMQEDMEKQINDFSI
ncbi:tyrosine-type recombinase/integrase [Lactobacillus delbrueckii]